MTSRLKNNAKKVFGREGLSKAVSYAKKYLPKIKKRSFLLFICMVAIVVLGTFIRFLPLKWGFNLSEFDPYFQYDVTRHIVKNGFQSWGSWHIDDMWFPQGRDVAYTSFPGLPMTGAAFYFIISSLGLNVSVLDACIVFPIVFAALTCIAVYYLGKEVGGKGVGLLSALFLATSPAYMSRTTLGFYDDETVGVLGIILTSLFYLRSLKREAKWQISLAYSASAGVGLGYVFASWGASRYLLSLMALFTFILFIAKRYSRRLLISYGALIMVGLSIALIVPKLGFNFLREFESVAALGVLLLLVVYEASQHLTEQRKKPFIVLAVTGLGILALALWQIGLITLPIAKFLSVLNPFERLELPLIESVQEHRPATWSSFYYQLGALVFLAPLGLIFATQKVTDNKLFISTYAVTALYFSASMIRLTVMMSPALGILGSLGMVELIRLFSGTHLTRNVTRRKLRISPTTGRAFSIMLFVTLFVLSLLPFGRGIDSGYAPTTISTSSLPIRSEIGDWTEALIWMKENLPENAVVASWWDYGYWTTVVSNKTSLADNGTFNGTQIAWLGRMFMSTEDDAITMMNDFNQYAINYYQANSNVSYVVVFTTLSLASSGQFLFGDEVKWRWMAKIGWNSTSDAPLEDTSITSLLADAWLSQTQDPLLQQWYSEFRQMALPKSDRVLTKLMIYGAFGEYLPDMEPEHFQLIFSSSLRLVFVYKVIY